jgi:hypothetical protein
MTEFLTEVHKLKRAKKMHEQKMYYYKQKYQEYEMKRDIVSAEILKKERGEDFVWL